MDLLIKAWPLLTAGATISAIAISLLWKISAGVTRVDAKLDIHSAAIDELNADVKELDRQSRAHSTAIAALEATQ